MYAAVKGKVNSQVYTLWVICNAFGITLREFFETADYNVELTEKEKILIEGTRKLDDRNRDINANLKVSHLT